jgi:hypothetical protein
MRYSGCCHITDSCAAAAAAAASLSALLPPPLALLLLLLLQAHLSKQSVLLIQAVQCIPQSDVELRGIEPWPGAGHAHCPTLFMLALGADFIFKEASLGAIHQPAMSSAAFDGHMLQVLRSGYVQMTAAGGGVGHISS